MASPEQTRPYRTGEFMTAFRSLSIFPHSVLLQTPLAVDFRISRTVKGERKMKTRVLFYPTPSWQGNSELVGISGRGHVISCNCCLTAQHFPAPRFSNFQFLFTVDTFAGSL